MNAIIAYLVKSVIASGILVLYYWLALRNRKFHRYNRFYLLSAIVISLIVPLLQFRLFELARPANKPVGGLLTMIAADSVERPPVDLRWQLMPLIFTVVVSGALLTILLLKIRKIYAIRRRHTPVKMNGYYFIETELDKAPFSFFNNLFWRSTISMGGENGQKIFRHELAHIREKHSYDKLFSQVVVCLFWMNPFYWIIQKELNLIHEFIADGQSVQEGDGLSFAKMLLSSHNDGRYLDPAHSFFNSSIKRRLIMITTSNKTSFSYLRRLLVLPVVVLVSVLFSFTIARAQDKSSKEAVEKAQLQKQNDEHLEYTNMTPGQRKQADELRSKINKEVDGQLTKHQAEEVIHELPDVLYLVNGTESSREAVKKLDPAKVKKIRIVFLNGTEKQNAERAKSNWYQEMNARYGDRAKNGVIELIIQ